MNTLALFAETTKMSDGAGAFWLVIVVVLLVLYTVACWRVYEKARKPGWAAIIPIYNIYVLLKIIGRPTWWLLLYLVPFVNAIVHIIVSIDLATAFRKSAVFGVLWLWLFPVGYLVLGFGDAKYKGVPKR